MKESVLDILIYLFENYADPDFQHELESGSQDDSAREALRDELKLAGFRVTAIDNALTWLDSLAEGTERPIAEPAARAIRVFSDNECKQLDTECRGYILYLEHIGILDATQRELVVDRLLALRSPANDQDIDIEQVKWVVLMVLFSQDGHEDAFARMEDLLFSGRLQALH
jgi:Smg protein